MKGGGGEEYREITGSSFPAKAGIQTVNIRGFLLVLFSGYPREVCVGRSKEKNGLRKK